MITYIWKLIPGFYIDVLEEIDPIYWDGMIGLTLEDFGDGKWVKLSNEQSTFHNEHKDASLSEVFNLLLDSNTGSDPINTAKIAKLKDLEDYDNSDAINDFTINNTIHEWFTQDVRSSYRNSIDAARLLGIDNLELFVGGNFITLSTDVAEQMLASIQLYADQCFLRTKHHKSAIEALNSVEEIVNYDYTVGYPAKLNFTL